MKTKIVYVLTSTESGFYIEQTLISVLSMRISNPSSYIVLVVDNDTFQIIKNGRDEILNFIDEIKPIETPDNLNKMATSRYLKTSLRFLIDGDFLFIDGDTVICDNIGIIDTYACDIGAVIDKHLNISCHLNKDQILDRAKKIGWNTKDWDGKYYNSGVMYVKDNPTTHSLYKKWHSEWTKGSKRNIYIDQPSLNKTNCELGNIIQELAGEWNCQIADNGLRYLYNAYIIHYFASSIHDGKTDGYAYKLMDTTLYQEIKQNGVTPTLIAMVSTPKCQFTDKITLISGCNCDFIFSPIVRISKKIYKGCPILNRFIGKLLTLREGLREC